MYWLMRRKQGIPAMVRMGRVWGSSPNWTRAHTRARFCSATACVFAGAALSARGFQQRHVISTLASKTPREQLVWSPHARCAMRGTSKKNCYARDQVRLPVAISCSLASRIVRCRDQRRADRCAHVWRYILQRGRVLVQFGLEVTRSRGLPCR